MVARCAWGDILPRQPFRHRIWRHTIVLPTRRVGDDESQLRPGLHGGECDLQLPGTIWPDRAALPPQRGHIQQRMLGCNRAGGRRGGAHGVDRMPVHPEGRQFAGGIAPTTQA